MVGKVGLITTGVASTALGLAGVGGIYLHLNNEIEEQQDTHTKVLTERDLEWDKKHTQLQTDYVGLQAAIKKHENDMSALTKAFAAKGVTWENEKKRSAEALDEYRTQVLGMAQSAEQKIEDTNTRVANISGRVDNNGTKIEKLESDSTLLSGRADNTEKNWKILKGDIEGISGKVDSVTTKIDGLKTDEEIRMAVAAKALPSVVRIEIHNKKSPSQGTGFLIENDKGELAIYTSGHLATSEKELMESKLLITFHQGLVIMLRNDKMPKGSINWSGYHDRDALLIRNIPKEIQDFLRKEGVSGLPILSPLIVPKEGSDLIVIGSPRGRDWTVSRGIFSRPYAYTSRGRIRRDYQTDVSTNVGSSGGPALNTKGEVLGNVSWGDSPRITLMTEDGKIIKGLKAEAKGNIGMNNLVSNADMVRFLLSCGFRPKGIHDVEIQCLIAQDVLNRADIFKLPASAASIGSFASPIWGDLFNLSRMDGYVFNPPKK